MAAGELAEAFLAEHRNRRGVNETTIRNYRERLRILLPALLPDPSPELFRELAEERGWSQATRATYWATLACFTAWAFRVGALAEDRFAGMKSPEQPAPAPKPLSELEVQLLAEAAKLRPRPTTSQPVDEWIVLARYAGMRAHEIANACQEHLRAGPNGPELEIVGKGGHRASVPAHPEVLKLFMRKGPGRLWPDATADRVSEAGRRLFRKVGVPGGIHRFRHTYATRLYQSTGDPFLVKDLCRHRTITSTLAYAQLADSKRVAAVGAL